jgi:uncharacterized phage protein (TIGR01671 family)
MREIKFRAKSGTQWRYGDLYHNDRGELMIYEPKTSGRTLDGVPFDGWRIKVDPETVGQFTGLCDCKEQEIFEGDVLEVSIFDYAGCDTRYKVSVDWYNGNFWCNALFVKVLKNWERLNPEKAGAWLLSDVLDNDCEAVIVGNVYDNPELLERKS